jgi:hypothetical protein
LPEPAGAPGCSRARAQASWNSRHRKGGAHRIDTVTLADTYRQPVFRQESRQPHLWEWTRLADGQWTHAGRELTPGGVRSDREGVGVGRPGGRTSEFRFLRRNRNSRITKGVGSCAEEAVRLRARRCQQLRGTEETEAFCHDGGRGGDGLGWRRRSGAMHESTCNAPWVGAGTGPVLSGR